MGFRVQGLGYIGFGVLEFGVVVWSVGFRRQVWVWIGICVECRPCATAS